ncbi:LacI family DNA-binding transcriptional regulator [Pseudonocardia spinosispora]|uniref:LacI family DNA-binding transcriptional regulator n=1 Tax=Pseudonocardia spinosispora TaxID=103441 RepID=UPI0004237D7B|nr:LacI family DNA-binding transcriptional regulator [Pseudonocardia spinosispora]
MTRSPRIRRPATLASLAAELGVSRTTVSNAYNRPDQLSVQLRTRVLETAKLMGYPGPDPVARSLRTRQARAVGLLLTEELSFAFRDPAALGFLEGLASACETAGQGLLLMPASRDDPDVSTVHQASVDGFVVYSVPENDPHLEAVLQRPLPTVVADQPMNVDGVDRVGVDDRGGMLTLARHLVELGHRRIGVLCMRLSNSRSDGYADLERQRTAALQVQRERLGGLRDGFAEAGVDWAKVPVVERYDHTVEAGALGAAQLLDDHPDITALVCTSDVLALGALRMARGRDLSVPGQLSVTGFDGVPEALRAGLTTVRQPVRDKGRTAGELLLTRGDRTEPKSVILPTEMLIGQTAAPPRAERWFSGL